MTSRPLWVPDRDQASQTNLARFAAGVGINIGADGGYESLHRWSVEDLGGFWSAVWDFCGVVASDRGSAALVRADHNADVRFFPDARLNFAENLMDGGDDDIAMVFADESGAHMETTRGHLRALVSRLASAMRAQGVSPGDRVACWMPNIPEAYAVMLAAASVGAVFSSTSPDFGTAGVLDHFGQIEPVILFAVDGYVYGGNQFDCRARLAEVRACLPTLAATVMLKRTGPGDPPDGIEDFDAWIEPHPAGPIQFEQLPFGHPLYVLYSSGTTGQPKCIVHRAGGILLKHLCEHQLHCDVRSGDWILYFTTTGWMMWNWLASAMASGAAAVVWDGNPAHPSLEALFDVVDRAGVTLFGTSARYIDSLRKAGISPRHTRSLGTLRTICSNGSPLSPDGFEYICATEHGGYVISGRSDATLNPGGVRIGTAEIYRLVDGMDEVVESVVVGQPVDGDTPVASEEGETPVGSDTRVVLFVKLAAGVVLDHDLEAGIRAVIRSGASPRHVPAVICAVSDIPRTRSGKTVELAVRDAVCGRPIANIEALDNPEALDYSRNRPELV